jgi:hypothetical protein
VNQKVDTLAGNIEENQQRTRQNAERIGVVDQKAEAAGRSASEARARADNVAAELQALREEVQALRDARAVNQPASSAEQFPWPPPRPTIRYQLPMGLVTKGAAEGLASLFGRVEEAMARAKIDEYATYAIGDNGFAVVARLEAIESDGRPKSGSARWTVQAPSSHFSLRAVVASLFFAPPGYYRVIALIVTDRVLGNNYARGELTPTAAKDLLQGSQRQLPADLKMNVAPAGARTEALIYEFERTSYDGEPELKTNGRIPPVQHLAGANLWPVNQLR